MSSHDLDIVRDPDLLEETALPKLKKPSLYQVVLLNDDYTPMDFVVELLLKFFNMDLDKATKVMMQIHTEGKGVCGIYIKEIAETRQKQINDYAKVNKHVLKSVVEKVN